MQIPVFSVSFIKRNLEMNIAIFQLRSPDQRPLHWAELGALGNPSFGEHSSEEPIYVEDQRQARSCPGEHRPVRDGMQGAMLRAHGRMCIVTLLTPQVMGVKRPGRVRLPVINICVFSILFLLFLCILILIFFFFLLDRKSVV